MELCLLIIKVNIYDIFQISIHVGQVLDVFAILQKSWFSAKSSHDHLIVRVQRFTDIIHDLYQISKKDLSYSILFISKDDNLVKSGHSLEEHAKAWSLQNLKACAKLFRVFKL